MDRGSVYQWHRLKTFLYTHTTIPVYILRKYCFVVGLETNDSDRIGISKKEFPLEGRLIIPLKKRRPHDQEVIDFETVRKKRGAGVFVALVAPQHIFFS